MDKYQRLVAIFFDQIIKEEMLSMIRVAFMIFLLNTGPVFLMSGETKEPMWKRISPAKRIKSLFLIIQSIFTS